MLRAILFDLGDTLLDSMPMSTSAVVSRGARDTYARLGQMGAKLPSYSSYHRGFVAAVRWALIWSRLRGREFSIWRIMRERTARYGVPNTDDIMMELGWLWYRPVFEHNSVADDVIPTLRQLRDAGIKLGVVSNTSIGGPLLDKHLKLAGLLEFFPVRIYSCEVGYRKPHRRIFQEAIDAIGESPRDILFVGDLVKKDIFGAGRMGMRTALRRRDMAIGSHSIADYCIRDISELLPVVLPKPATVVAVAPRVAIQTPALDLDEDEILAKSA